jgi:FemAB-related protein (PEP-CTERM system-associated)
MVDDFVRHWPAPILYQLPAWRQIVKSAYGHQTYCFTAAKEGTKSGIEISNSCHDHGNHTEDTCINFKKIAGILPLVHLKSFIFGNDLISMPFFDSGGVLAGDAEVEKALLGEAVSLGRRLKVGSIQLRQTVPLLSLTETGAEKQNVIADSWLSGLGCIVQKRMHKARMLLELPDSSEALMGSFKSKLRSQVRKPIKEGLTAKVGGLELLDQFYEIFSINMRDLGSPVHSRRFIKSVLEGFPEESRICLVYKEQYPLACSIIIGFNGVVYNPWASSLRKYSKLSPNMLLYWTMLQYACDNGYRHFDFGRSSIEESTYKFKEQWGAQPKLLYWYYIYFKGPPPGTGEEKSKFDLAVRIWQKLPVHLTRVLGPAVRKHIGL